MILISKTLRFFLQSWPFCLAILLVLAFTTVSVQGQSPEDPKPENDTDVLNKAELDLQRLVPRQFFREEHVAISINRKLTAILKNDPVSPLRSRIEADLEPVQEFLGEKSLAVAKFYLNRERGGIRGAESRLLQIVTDYPQFSKMDEVLFHLSTVALRDERAADGRSYLRKLICRYPASGQTQRAFERLTEIGFGEWQGCEPLKQ